LIDAGTPELSQQPLAHFPRSVDVSEYEVADLCRKATEWLQPKLNDFRNWQIVLQKSFCLTDHKFSES